MLTTCYYLNQDFFGYLLAFISGTVRFQGNLFCRSDSPGRRSDWPLSWLIAGAEGQDRGPWLKPVWDLTLLRTQKRRADWSRTAGTGRSQREMSLTTTAGVAIVLLLAALQVHVLMTPHRSPVHSVMGCLLLTWAAEVQRGQGYKQGGQKQDLNPNVRPHTFLTECMTPLNSPSHFMLLQVLVHSKLCQMFHF